MNVFRLTIFQLLLDWTGSHLIRVGGGLLVIALAVTSILIVAALLAVFGLVTSLGAGVGVLLTVASLTKGIGGRLLFLRWDVCPGECSHPASLLEDEPQVAYPQDHVDEAKSLWSREVFRDISSSSQLFLQCKFVLTYFCAEECTYKKKREVRQIIAKCKTLM